MPIDPDRPVRLVMDFQRAGEDVTLVLREGSLDDLGRGMRVSVKDMHLDMVPGEAFFIRLAQAPAPEIDWHGNWFEGMTDAQIETRLRDRAGAPGDWTLVPNGFLTRWCAHSGTLLTTRTGHADD